MSWENLFKVLLSCGRDLSLSISATRLISSLVSLSSEEEIEYKYVTDKERAREKLLHRKIILILAICVCVYSSCCSTNSWGNKNKNCNSIYSLIYFTEHLGDELVRESMLAWGKRNAVLIPKTSSSIHHEILSVNFRRPPKKL